MLTLNRNRNAESVLLTAHYPCCGNKCYLSVPGTTDDISFEVEVLHRKCQRCQINFNVLRVFRRTSPNGYMRVDDFDFKEETNVNDNGQGSPQIPQEG